MTSEEFMAFYSPLTRSLKNLIANYEQSLPPEQFTSLLNHIGLLLDETKNKLSQWPSGSERAQRVHALVEAEVEKANTIATTCTKGCAACCHLEVEVTNEEASVLADLVERGHAINTLKLELQSKRKHRDDAWKAGATSNNRCLFLGAYNACSIYESRPSTCRRHSVVSPVEICESFNQAPVIRNIPQVDILLSAVMSLDGVQFGSLSKMLSAELQRRQEPVVVLDTEVLMNSLQSS